MSGTQQWPTAGLEVTGSLEAPADQGTLTEQGIPASSQQTNGQGPPMVAGDQETRNSHYQNKSIPKLKISRSKMRSKGGKGGKNLSVLKKVMTQTQCSECNAQRNSTACYCPSTSPLASQHTALACHECKSILYNNIICSVNKSCSMTRSKMLKAAESMINSSLLEFQSKKIQQLQTFFNL